MARICPDWLRHQQEDLVQVAMEKILSLLQRSEGNRQFNTSYLMKIAHSVMVDEIRSQQRRQEVALDDSEHLEVPDPLQQTPSTAQDLAALGAAMKVCMRQMIENRSQAVTLHLQGYTVNETAATLGWAYKKAENCVYRGLADLRECLRRHGFDGANG